MSIYILHQKGILTSKSQKDKKLMLINSIEEHNKFLNYRYDKEFNCIKPLSITLLPFIIIKSSFAKIIRMIKPKIIVQLFDLMLPPFLISYIKRK